MLEKILRNSKDVAFYSLAGYFFTTTFSHFLAQIAYASALLFAMVAFFGDKSRSHKLRLSPFNIFILLFLGWSILSALVGATPLKSILMLKKEWLFLMIPTVVFLADSEKKIKTLIKTLVISAILVSIFGIVQHYIAPYIYHGHVLSVTPAGNYRTSGGFSQYITFGNYFAIASIFLFGMAAYVDKLKWRIIFYIASFLTALATIFTYSYGPILALAIGFILFVIFFGKRNILITSIAIIVIAAATFLLAPKIQSKLRHTVEVEWAGKYEGSRFVIWRAAERMIEEYPIFGVGRGNFENLYLQYCDPGNKRKFPHAHNDILNIAAYAGIPAALFFLGFWCIIINRMIELVRNSTVIGLCRGVAIASFLGTLVFFATSQYDASFNDEEIRLFLMAIWGLFLAVESIVKLTLEKAENIEKA